MIDRSAVSVPKIKDIRRAVIIFYENSQIGTTEIAELFGCSRTKALNLKKAVVQRMEEKGMMQYSRDYVETETAFETWGLDIKNLESRMRKLEKLTGTTAEGAVS